MASDETRRGFGSFGRLAPGRRIAGYLIEEQIGAGGMAVVFRARDELLGRLAAVKVITPSMADDEEFRVRFLRESRAAAAVDSPYIIPVFGAGEADGLLYIATRFVAGGDLARLVRRPGGLLTVDRVVKLVSQIASALDAAHAAGLVHRDVKPQNILIDLVPDGSEHAYLSDFGLSKGMSSTGLTAAGQFLGTPDYSAPEQIRGSQVDGRADQYALACVAFSLLTGSPPFHRQETVAVMFAHLQDPVPSATGLRPELPAAVDGVLARGMAKDPDDRYGRCGEFAAALRGALTPARPVTAPDRQFQLAPDGEPSVSPAPQEQPPRVFQSPASQTADWSRPTQTSSRGSGPPALTTGAAAAVGPGAGYGGLSTDENRIRGRGEDTPVGAGGRRRGKGAVIWAAGAAVALAAGVAAAVVFHGPSSKPGLAGQTPPSTAVSATSSPADVGKVSATVLADDEYGSKYGLSDPQQFANDGSDIWVLGGGNSVVELSAATGAYVRTLTTGYGFSFPDGIAFDGTNIWVANLEGNSVSEFNASSGAFVRWLSGGNYGFANPAGIAFDGANLWVANSDSVTELSASTGAWIRTLSGASYGFNNPQSIVADSSYVWVANYASPATDSSVTQLNASNGTVVRIMSYSQYGFKDPAGFAIDGANIWITSGEGGGAVREINASSGAVIRTLKNGSYGFKDPAGIAFDGANIWVANREGGSVTELSASTGAWIRTLKSDYYDFNGPYGIAAYGQDIYVANENGHSVTELVVTY